MKKNRLAFLTSMLTNPLSKKIYLGIKDYIEDKDVSLFTFTGGSLIKEFNEWIDITSNTIYELPTNKHYDALIIYAGSIGQYIGSRDILDFCRKFKIPVINISYYLPEIPSVIVSNTQGMYQLCCHLIKEHNYSKLAFIKGPEKHNEAIDRFKGYKKALEYCGLVFKEEYICRGDFSQASEAEGVKTLLDIRGLKPDSIVCVDDDTALGVI